MKKFRLLDRRILWVVALAVLILLMMEFNNRLGEMMRLNGEREQVGARLTQLVATQQNLEKQIAYATSDVAVQEWARQDGHLSLPGDIPIVPIAPAGSTPTPQVVHIATAEPVENWQVWNALFFGK
ncbi:MAG TPA: septum formation initiator family protein [Anaerolineaceae bacterium]|jgi:cell division protein FtsB